MAHLRLALTLGAALVLLTPGAFAASARGELETNEIVIPESARVDAAGLDIMSTGSTPPQVDLRLTDVAIQRIGVSTVTSTVPSASWDDHVIDETGSYASATITLLQGEADQIVALRAFGPSVATLGPSSVRGVAGVFLASAAPANADGGDPGQCAASSLYCLDVFGAYELAGDALASIESGEITLLLFGPTLRVSAPEETREFRSGVFSKQTTGPVSQSETAWVVLHAKSAAGSVSASAARLYSGAPTIRASSLELRDAEGSMRVGASNYLASSDDVRAVGEIVLTPGPVERAANNGLDGQPAYASSFSTRVTGDVQSINLNAKPVFLDTPAKQAGFAAILAVLIGGIAYAWQHISFLGAALYTRLNKPDILDNDVRNRIYDIIRHHPGISAREVHRQSEQSWGTVVYHLRQLERHHLVVSRSLGRTRNYYENHGKYRGMEVQLACLQSDRALVLARAIATQPGITQEQLAAASGYPQPTTSYYVRKLKQAGLVEEQREGRYVKYVPHADLPRFIALSEQPDLSTPAASGVQA